MTWRIHKWLPPSRQADEERGGRARARETITFTIDYTNLLVVGVDIHGGLVHTFHTVGGKSQTKIHLVGNEMVSTVVASDAPNYDAVDERGAALRQA